MNICVASPYALDELKGNSVTTRRIVNILNEANLEARGSHGFDGAFADVLIALHAAKGTDAVLAYKANFPKGRVILLITGTDLYVDLPAGRGLATLEEADAIVFSHPGSIGSVPAQFRDKVYVVPSSLEMPNVFADAKSPPFVISVVGHLRPVKRSFLTIEALAQHPEWDHVEVWQMGEALDEESSARACDWEDRDQRYRWLGGMPREESLRLCAKSSLTVNSSQLEGGANAVLEAMTMGVPILASQIEGNVGLLGKNYSGYFKGEGLEAKLCEIIVGQHDLSDWAEQAIKRLPFFSRESEMNAWLALFSLIVD